MTDEARAHLLKAAEELSAARDIEQRAWLDGPRTQPHTLTVWWHLNELVIHCFKLALRDPDALPG